MCSDDKPNVSGTDAVLRLHHENPRYLSWRGRSTVLVTSGEHYGAVMNASFDYMAYLDELQSVGLNLTRIFSGVYCEAAGDWDIENNTLAPGPGNLLCPFARSDTPGERAPGSLHTPERSRRRPRGPRLPARSLRARGAPSRTRAPAPHPEGGAARTRPRPSPGRPGATRARPRAELPSNSPRAPSPARAPFPRAPGATSKRRSRGGGPRAHTSRREAPAGRLRKGRGSRSRGGSSPP